jgi:MFS family permease
MRRGTWTIGQRHARCAKQARAGGCIIRRVGQLGPFDGVGRLGFLDKSHSVAPQDYNRWLVPPAALCIHLSIGQAYGWSVFNKPLTKLLGVAAPAEGDWSETQVVRIFSLAIAFLGLSAAFGGKWLERVGPRKAMFVSALCFGSGFFISALGAELHSLTLIYLGYGVIGGIGLGLGYIAPVSTLIRWFPDRPGLATGMAIMGFGGGAMVGSPLAVMLMDHYKTPTDVGVTATLLTLGAGYLVFMLIGAFTVRVPPPDWKPAGWTPSAVPKKMVTRANVHADRALRTPQFYLLWAVLFLNVTAGISILAKAADMIQDMFAVTAAAAGGFTGLLSLPNMGGRFLWSTASDYLGRKTTYAIYFALGLAIFALLPTLRTMGMGWFLIACVIIMSMYGGGFATMPAYIRDLFGTMHVSAILGRVLTAWALAGIVGPELITRLAVHQKAAGVDRAQAYDLTMYLMAGVLALGLLADLLMRPVHASHHHVESDSGHAR